MKKLSGITFFVFALFFIVGCTNNNSDILPTLKLIGDSITEVEQYSDFVDPGIEIIGDFDLDVTTTGTVDTNTLGDYTLTYTITYLGISYDISRTVRVVEVGSDINPGLQLVGDATIEVEQYSDFVDPGATLIGDFDLDIKVESNVDTNVIGSYTITYTITYNDIDYTINRSVKVVEPIMTKSFTIEMEKDDVTARSISAIITLTDENSIISDGLIELHENGILIDSMPLANGTNYAYFDALSSHTTYTIKVSGKYPNENQKLINLSGYELELTTMESKELSIDIIEPEITTTSIDFKVSVIDKDNKLKGLTVEILDGQTSIDSVDIFNQLIEGELGYSFAHVSFDSLTPSHTYTINIKHTYLPVGETFVIEGDILSAQYTTLQTIIPTVISHDVIERYYTLEGTIILDDSDYENYIITAKLYQNENQIDTYHITEDSSYIFDYLDNDTAYSISVYASFTVISTGASYEDILVDQMAVSTKALGSLASPTVENVLITQTNATINVTFDLIDIDNAMRRGFIYLYKDSTSYGANAFVKGNNTITFDSSIYEGTLYTINIKADYKGNGSFESIYEEDVYIPPVITVNSFEPQAMFYNGDHLVLNIALNNSNKAIITGITINDIVYDTFLFPTDYKTLYVDLGVKETNTFELELQNIIITFNEQDYLINTEASLEVEVYEKGTIVPDDAKVSVIDIVPMANYVVLDRDGNDNKGNVIVDIYLENKYGLLVTGIKIGGIDYAASDINIISDTHLQVIAEMGYNSSNPSNNSLYFGHITFERNDETIISDDIDHIDAFVYKLYDYDNNGTTSNEIIHISTPEELMAISNYSGKKLYILDNDIDMTSYTWSPIGTYDDAFIGAFNGNGYTISNVHIDMTLPATNDSNHYIGLFGYTKAFIFDLNIDYMQITIHSDVSNYIYVGALAGKSESDVVNVHVTNAHITVDGVIKGAIGGLVGTHRGDMIRSSANTNITDVTFTDATSDMRLYVGGLIGDKQYQDVRHSSASGDITVAFSSAQTVFAGGLIGSASADNAIIANSFASGNLNISGDYYTRVGGLVGNSFETTVDNSFALGDVHASAGKTGGLIGESDGYVSASFATGTITSDAGPIGKIFGYGNNYRLSLMYAYDDQELYFKDSPTDGSDYYYTYLGIASKTQFNDASYYTDFLGWSSHYYNFTNLDIENNILPIFN